MSPSSTPILFLPGSWHGAWCWSEVIADLAPYGRPALAVDLAGHGLRARRPACLTVRPFDAAKLATEVSPVATVDLDQAADLLASQVKQLGRGGPVTVVAHSMGGHVLTRVAQQVPELVAHAVYIAAVMPASGSPADPYFVRPENAGALVLSALRGDPDVTGALRLDLASGESDRRRHARRLTRAVPLHAGRSSEDCRKTGLRDAGYTLAVVIRGAKGGLDCNRHRRSVASGWRGWCAVPGC
ncbi:alpha/beta fold hydrolase [Phytohabitans sp. LJ34]|uniref:alpha/beta fold hydrolase n=1 Tax=Phytohabitans sp. LJ34 TaxID=3452217 RepID=UPI003F8B1D2A